MVPEMVLARDGKWACPLTGPAPAHESARRGPRIMKVRPSPVGRAWPGDEVGDGSPSGSGGQAHLRDQPSQNLLALNSYFFSFPLSKSLLLTRHPHRDGSALRLRETGWATLGGVRCVHSVWHPWD